MCCTDMYWKLVHWRNFFSSRTGATIKHQKNLIVKNWVLLVQNIWSDRNLQHIAKTLQSSFHRIFNEVSDHFQLLRNHCDVCSSRRISRYRNPIVAQLPYRFFQCKNCDFIYVYPKPDPINVYSDSEVVEMGAEKTEWNDHYLQSIEKYRPQKGHLLEIGFGDAGFLKLAHQHGWNVHGLELSAPCVRHARHTLTLPNIEKGTIKNVQYPDHYFDVVAAFNFIEHVPDLHDTLRRIRRILRPNGLLMLLCPNISGLVHLLIPELFGINDPLGISWVPPMHLSYFNKNNFRQLLENSGFRVIADASNGTESLWLQHKVTFGPEVTNSKLEQLLAEIQQSRIATGQARVAKYWERIVEVFRQRLVWDMISGIMPLEAALGSENAILYIAEKQGV